MRLTAPVASDRLRLALTKSLRHFSLHLFHKTGTLT